MIADVCGADLFRVLHLSSQDKALALCGHP